MTCYFCYFIVLDFILIIYCYLFVFVFFFKQKTAYEMRISDWSSDVCSSDLSGLLHGRRHRRSGRQGREARRRRVTLFPSRLREGLGEGLSGDRRLSFETDPPPTPPASGRGEIEDMALKFELVTPAHLERTPDANGRAPLRAKGVTDV